MLRSRLEQQLADAKKVHAETESAMQDFRKVYSEAAQLNSHFQALDKAEKQQASLLMKAEEIEHKKQDLVRIRRAKELAAYFDMLDNIMADGKYYYLTELAAKCTAKRLVPDYISEKKMFELKEGNCYPCMGCRSFLTVYRDETGRPKFYGRFNQGVVTINLVDVACSSGKDETLFWKIFDERLELCKRALMLRHKRLLGTPSDVAPILWQNGALAPVTPEISPNLRFNAFANLYVVDSSGVP